MLPNPLADALHATCAHAQPALKNGLAEAAAAAGAAFAAGDASTAALAAAPSDLPTPSDSGSQTRDHRGARRSAVMLPVLHAS